MYHIIDIISSFIAIVSACCIMYLAENSINEANDSLKNDDLDWSTYKFMKSVLILSCIVWFLALIELTITTTYFIVYFIAK
jgi:hypothetical protein